MEGTIDTSVIRLVNTWKEQREDEIRAEKRAMRRAARIVAEQVRYQTIIKFRNIFLALSLALICVFGGAIGVLAQGTNDDIQVITIDEGNNIESVKDLPVATDVANVTVNAVADVVVNDIEDEEVEALPVETSNYNTYDSIQLSDDEYWLYVHIVAAEVYPTWSEDDMLQIASVIRNRLEAKEGSFKNYNTVKSVLTATNQFETYSNGNYLTVEPNEKVYNAVNRALAGEINIPTNYLYFCTNEYYITEKNSDFFHQLGLMGRVNNVLLFAE